jgi:ABC-type oligopeptide transport system substrate-binding subunit
MTSSPLDRLKLSSLAFQTLLASLVLGLSVTMALASPNPKANPADPEKVLKVAFPVPETGFDPVRVNDLYSNTITGVIFQPLLTYDWMAMPTRLVPNAAESMPVVSDDQTTFTFKVKKHKLDDVFFVSVLTSPDMFEFIGSIKSNVFRHSKKSRIYDTSQSVKVFDFVLSKLNIANLASLPPSRKSLYNS